MLAFVLMCFILKSLFVPALACAALFAWCIGGKSNVGLLDSDPLILT